MITTSTALPSSPLVTESISHRKGISPSLFWQSLVALDEKNCSELDKERAFQTLRKGGEDTAVKLTGYLLKQPDHLRRNVLEALSYFGPGLAHRTHGSVLCIACDQSEFPSLRILAGNVALKLNAPLNSILSAAIQIVEKTSNPGTEKAILKQSTLFCEAALSHARAFLATSPTTELTTEEVFHTLKSDEHIGNVSDTMLRALSQTITECRSEEDFTELCCFATSPAAHPPGLPRKAEALLKECAPGTLGRLNQKITVREIASKVALLSKKLSA